jgi:Predicted HD-superfamily hydrolase
MKNNTEELLIRYEALKSLVVSDRSDSFAELMKYVEMKTSFLTAPASTKYHLCEENGLLRHSVGVAETLLLLRDTLAPDAATDESCVIVGLLHDLGKAGYPGNPLYFKRDPSPKQAAAGFDAWPPYEYNKDMIYMSVPLRSLYHVMQHIYLMPEEAQAIMYHDGQYVEDNRSVAAKEMPLTLLLQYADNWNGFVTERS